MPSTIDSRLRANEIPRGSIIALLAVAGVVLVLAFVRAGIPVRPDGSVLTAARQLALFQYPHAMAAGLTLAQGLKEFSGGPADDLSPRMAALILAGFLITVPIGMPILLASIRRRIIEGRAPFLRVGAIVGFLLSGVWAISILPLTVVQTRFRASMAEAQGVQRVKDEMVYRMMEIEFLARQHARRSASGVHAPGSFRGFVLPSHIAVTTRATYDVVVDDTTLVITGRSRIDPVSVFTAAPELPAPDWTVQCTLTMSGRTSWANTGRFE